MGSEWEITEHHIYQIEKMERAKDELAASSGKPRFLKHIVIEDVDGLSWSHFNSQFLSVAKKILHIDENYYPEVAGKLYLIRVPWLFSGLWNIMKPLLAARTLAKIEICGANYTDALLQDIDKS